MTGQAAGRARRTTPMERRERRGAVEDPVVVLEAAAAFLTVRPRSVEEVRRRLRHLGYRHDLVDGVVARLVELGYLDDEAFARAWVESRDHARPRGAGALRRELALKGVDPAVVAAVLEERDEVPGEGTEAGETPTALPDEVAAARLLTHKAAVLGRETDPRKRRQKAYALLARHGFSPDVIAAALGRDV